MTQVGIKYDLEERTAAFAERIIKLCKRCSKNIVTMPIIDSEQSEDINTYLYRFRIPLNTRFASGGKYGMTKCETRI